MCLYALAHLSTTATHICNNYQYHVCWLNVLFKSLSENLAKHSKTYCLTQPFQPILIKRYISFLASRDFFPLMITFANSLDPDQDRLI